MTALRDWNGGVIVISHDERFITTVAKEVCLGSQFSPSADFICSSSYGCVPTVPLRSSRVMYKLTRFGPVVSQLVQSAYTTGI